MQVNIGPYIDWIGPYQIADKLKYIGLSQERCNIVGDYLNDHTPLDKFCKWIYNGRKRKINVYINNYDTWSAYDSLAQVIHPILLALRDNKVGAPYVDDEDVPEHLRSTSAPPKENEYDVDDNHFTRWDYVLDEMIWTFYQYTIDWEEQFHSGIIDANFDKSEDGTQSIFKTGPNHTHKFDREGLQKHEDRMNNGTRLFGKYYRNLWT